jgi:hypothetical protein
MREIKFRAWTDRNCFIKNYCYLDTNNHFFGEDLTNGPIVKILAVEQFTGLYDCEGKEIYEGDIVKAQGSKKEYKIIFSNGSFCGIYSENGFDHYCAPENFQYTEIIGNIHEAKQ